MSNINILIQDTKDSFEKWVNHHYFQLALFNIFIVILSLLRSAGYFEPFFLITINLIVLISLVMMITLLKINSKFLFFLASLFWAFAGVLQLLQVSVWAERTVIYSFEAVFIGMIQLIIEVISKKD